MENIKAVQKRIKGKRDAYNKADLVYYDALQQWSLSQQGIVSGSGAVSSIPSIEAMRNNREKALAALNTEISSLGSAVAPQDWLAQIPADLPFLLLPVRTEARYVTVRHIVRNLSNADALDTAGMSPVLSDFYKNIGFKNDEAGSMTYQVPALHLYGGPSAALLRGVMTGSLKPASGKLIKRKNDTRELRIRIYPDELFQEGLERNLQPGEWEAGVQFWQKVCGGSDPQEQWLQLSLSSAATRAAWIVQATLPTNVKQGKPLPVKPVFPKDKPLKDGAFTYPLKTQLLPDRFVVRLYKGETFTDFTGNIIPEPLLLGPDPTHDPFSKLAGSGMADNGTLISTPDYMAWIHDFDAAEKMGMAIRIDLLQNPAYSDGVDKIVVLGAKLSVDETTGSALLERQLEDHLYRENGLSILPQGTPTNNYGSQKTIFGQREEDALSYFNARWQPPVVSSLVTDEERLTRALGLSTTLRLPRGNSVDISEAALVNELLWPATWGYYLLQFFSPDLDEPTREQARRFFIQQVSGRGNLPVLRFNRQPYGIIPVSAFSSWQYQPAGIGADEQFSSQLWSGYLSRLNEFWKILAGRVQNVNTVSSQGLDDNFFRMIGISASSDQLQKQWVAGIQFQDVLTAAGPGTGPLFADPLFNPAAADNALLQLGINPGFFKQVTGAYNTQLQQVRRVFMDGRPLSDEQPLERIAGKAWNFPQWLAQSSLADIWNNNFDPAPAGDGDAISSATLSAFAILLRQAVLRTYLETGMRVAETNDGLWLLKVKDFPAQHLGTGALNINPANLPAGDKLLQSYKPIIDHFQLSQPFSLERDRRLYFSAQYAATSQQTLGDWLQTHQNDPALQPLKKMTEGLQYISHISTASLNRLFTEHLDLCSHRLDAWMQGLVNQRLEKQRKAKPNGLLLGSFGYLLNLKPNQQASVIFKEEAPEYLPLLPANVNSAAIPIINSEAAKQQGMVLRGKGWQQAFFYIGENAAAGVRLNTVSGHTEPDETINLSATDGFIHAPSTEHATAAAILRAGYLNHQADNQTALLALQLNSPRTRQALQLLEGMQGGASLNELLGYYFERKLKENNLNADLYNLRMAFPIQRTETAGESPSVLTTIDGLALLKRRRSLPTAWLSTVAGIDPVDFTRIDLVAAMLEDYLDALGDLLLAESIYQSVKGNTVRAAAALKIMNGGGQVVFPEFVKTPGRGTGITHRVGIICKQAANTTGKAWTTTGSPRSALLPGMNVWLSLQLPKAAAVVIAVTLSNGTKQKLSLKDLKLEPIDLLLAFPPSFAQAAQSALALFVQRAASEKFSAVFAGDAAGFSIDFKDRSLLTASQLTVFEISSLVIQLRKLLTQARPLTANDFLLPGKPAAAADRTDTARLAAALKKQVSGNAASNQLIQDLQNQANALLAGISQHKEGAALEALVKPILSSLLDAWQQGIESGAADGVFYLNQAAAATLAARAMDTARLLKNRMAASLQLISGIPAETKGPALFDKLKEAADLLYGASMPVVPDIRLANTTEVTDCYTGRDKIENTGPDEIDQWVREASLVRKSLKVYRSCSLLAALLSAEETTRPLTVLQFPFVADSKQPWIGSKLPVEQADGQTASLSLALDIPDAFKPQSRFAGFIIDEWPEWLPSKTVDTGVTFQYNQPNTEPPQSILMAVTPVENGNWNWEYLVGAVNDALELAKKRLVTPGDIRAGNTGISQALPAILMPFMAENQQTPVVEPL